jgi:hypothetical protein
MGMPAKENCKDFTLVLQPASCPGMTGADMLARRLLPEFGALNDSNRIAA